METKNPKTDLDIKVMIGVNRAVRKLIEDSAANDQNLIVGDENRNPISVPAKELLKKLNDNVK